MRYNRPRGLLLFIAPAAALFSGLAAAQGPPVATTAPEPSPDVRALADAVGALQTQVEALRSQLEETRLEEARDRAETQQLRSELDRALANATLNTAERTARYDPSVSPQSVLPAAPTTGAAQEGTIEERLKNIEEDQQLIDARMAEQNQTKVESASKYRVRLSGIVLMSMFYNRGVVDNQDVPEIALEPRPLNSPGTFGGSLRQSQIGLEAFGPDLAGAHTSANLKFDFAGGFPETPNGVSMGIVRLRTATVRFDWGNTSLVAGQDQLFFSPLAPTSLATLAIPALSYSGNLWSWTPQIRVEHRVRVTDGASVLLQAGILDSLSGEAPATTYERGPTWGESSGQPAYAARISSSAHIFGQDATAGVGGYYGRQSWAPIHNVDGWAGTADLTLPLGRLFELTGAFYRGRAVGGLSGAIGQDVLLSGPLGDPMTTVRGLDSMGGWAQLKFKPTTKFEVNGAFGQDNPFAGELRMFPESPSSYGALLSKNSGPFANFIYQARSDILFSIEYRRLRTTALDEGSYSANHLSFSVGYLF